MAMTVEVVEYLRDDPSAVASVLAELRGAGRGWINLGPALSDEEWRRVPHKTGLAKWISGRGPAVPMATWAPGRPEQLGVTHGTGPKAITRLREVGVVLPDGWVLRQDHARNGLVVDVPADADPDRIVVWLMGAVTELSTVIATGRHWIAEIHRADR